jgi:leucyl-tRNA synthetase
VLEAAKASTKVQEYIAGKSTVREIVVPDRLVNIVVK